MNDDSGRRSRETPTVELGIADWRVPVHSHIGCLWATESDFASAVGFLETGLRGSDHCVVVGAGVEPEPALTILESRGIDVEASLGRNRLRLIRPNPSAREMLDRVVIAFEEAVAAGAPLVRLFGNVDWDRGGWPADAELVAFEALLTEIAERFDSVLLCLHRLPSINGLILRHGVLGTHPRTLDEGRVQENPLFVPVEKLPPRLASAAAVLATHRQEQEAIRRETEILQSVFDNIPVMISFRDPEGRLLLVNREWERRLGWTLEEAQQIDVLVTAYPDLNMRRDASEAIRRAERVWTDFTTRLRDGRVIETSWAHVSLSDGTRIGFGQDITERKHAVEALRLSEERYRESSAALRALAERLRVVREEERAGMAREVHDEVGQALTALRMDVAWLERRLASPADPGPELQTKLRTMSELIDTTLDTVQRIATELRPGVLDELGLEAAIEGYLAEFEQRTGIACRFRSELQEVPADSARAVAVFRILQEALTNVARHAVATRAKIRLSSDSTRLRLEIRDNGRGIPADRIESSASLGLVGMRERAHVLGGSVEISGETGRGTTVAVTIPL
jgi:two-component system sensor histidine kinase UhpB